MTELEVGTKRKIYCNQCKSETHHVLKSIHSQIFDEVDYDSYSHPMFLFREETQYRFWVCLGCDTGTLEDAYSNTGMHDNEGKDLWDSKFYPKRKYADLLVKRFQKLNIKLESIYREIIESFNSNLNILCAVGLRALLEGICADKNITKGNLETKIDKLVDHLPFNIVQSLHSFRFIGNEAAHELQAPQRSELSLAIEVIEDLLNFLYEIDYKAQKLSKKRHQLTEKSVDVQTKEQ